MPEIHCHIPITVRITGRPSEADLDALGATLARAISARLTFAEKHIAATHAIAPRAYEIVKARDGFKPERSGATPDVYDVPSYEGPPKTSVSVRVSAAGLRAKGCAVGHQLGFGELTPKGDLKDMIARVEAKIGAISKAERADIEESFYYRIWGTWTKADLKLADFAQRAVNAWVPWRFGPLAPDERAKVFDYLFKAVLEPIGPGVGMDGCDYFIFLSRADLAKVTELSGEPRREAARKKARETLEAAAAGKLDFAKITVDQRLVLLEDRIKTFWTGGHDEEEILEILRKTPNEQAAELSRRLSTDRIGDETFADALDRVVDLGNNKELHEELTRLHLRGLGAKQGLEALLYNAPILPWHDVMGVFAPVGGDRPATFSLSRIAGGKIRIKYHQGFMLIGTTMPFQSEIDALPDKIKWAGVDYDADQMLKVHDWDESKIVLVRARDLVAYQHIGIRNWLGHVATIASFAIPGGALAGSTAKIALAVFKTALSAFIFVVQENRLKIMQWFPTWGPRMIYFADVAQVALTLYDIGAMARSGAKFIAAWREARFARKLWDAANAVDEAEQVAVKMEKEADKVFAAYEDARKIENAAGNAPGARKPTEIDLEGRLGGKPGKPGAQTHGAPTVREAPLAQEPLAHGHHLEISAKGVEMCSPPPCPLLNLMYANELKGSKALANEWAEVDRLRKAGAAAEAAKKAKPLQETLEQAQLHPKLFKGLKGDASYADQQKLAAILIKAEKQGVTLDAENLDAMAKRLSKGEFDKEIVAIEQNVDAAIQLADAKGAKISPLAEIPDALGFKPDFLKSFKTRASLGQQRRLTQLLEKANRSGVRLDGQVVEELSRRLSLTGDIESELASLERQLQGAIEKHEFAGAFNRPGKQKFLEPTDPTIRIRGAPGVAHGGEKLPNVTGDWAQPARGTQAALGPVDYRILPMPGQIASKMRKRRFANFDEFRKEFWRLVSQDKQLAESFNYDKTNLQRMTEGKAPKVPGVALAGRKEYGKGLSNIVYQIDHVRSLENGGGVYDLDNMHIVTWLTHVEIGE